MFLKHMQFMSMDLIGKFHPNSTAGNCYAIIVIFIFTGYTFCIPIKFNSANEVVHVYMDNVDDKVGGSTCILSDNGIDIKRPYF